MNYFTMDSKVLWGIWSKFRGGCSVPTERPHGSSPPTKLWLPHSGNKHYSLKFKTGAAVYCLNSGHSERDTCKEFKIPATSTLRRWILLYNGHELEPSPGGKGKIMTKGRKTTLDERSHIVEECVRSGLDYDGRLNEKQVPIVKAIHESCPDKGCRRIRDDIFRDYGIAVSENRILRICKFVNIKSTINFMRSF